MFNEEENVCYLLDQLRSARDRLRETYRIHVVLVDDGSTDRTWQVLRSACEGEEDLRLLRHDKNRGISAAIMTGIRAAETDIVCSMDSDCSYDPRVLRQMVPLLDGAAMVTASPYHPDGRAVGVPAWRLFLSRNLSRLYSRALGERLHTWTSCFRVYDRSAVADLELDHGGFLGIAELAIRLMRSGKRIVEYPTALGTRIFGASKMKSLRAIRGHLRLLRAVRRRRI